eukprot:scaffold2134_cov182-Alexandrium_tamarense.AAC.2
MPPLTLFAGDQSNELVLETFKSSGLTEREMTALLGCLLSIETIEKATQEGDWKASKKPKFREAGKIGRMLEFKALSDEDIANELAKDSEEDEGESYTIRLNVANGNGDANNFSSTLKKIQKEKQGGTQYAWIREFLLSKGEFAGCFTFCGLSPPLFASKIHCLDKLKDDHYLVFKNSKCQASSQDERDNLGLTVVSVAVRMVWAAMMALVVRRVRVGTDDPSGSRRQLTTAHNHSKC